MPSSQSTDEFHPADRPPEFEGRADAGGPGFARVSAGGELDIATAPKLGEVLVAVPNGTAVVILDLRELTFMDSTALHVILNATARLAEAGCRLVLIPGGRQFQRVFEITGTKQHLEFVAAPNAPDSAIVPSPTEALWRAPRLWLKVSYVTAKTHAPFALAPCERRASKRFALDPQRSHPDGPQSPVKGRGPDSRFPPRWIRQMIRARPSASPPSTQPRSRSSRSAARPAVRQTDPRELFARWQQDRDRAAQDQLVERYLPLAWKLARRYTGPYESPEDLMQVASYGLLKALERFDVDRGVAFSSFAVPTILGELKRYFRDLGWSVHVPRGRQELALKVQAAQEKLTSRTGRSPTAAEIAQYLELGVEDVLDGLEVAQAHHSCSLDAPHDDGDGEPGTLVDTFGQEDAGFELVEDATTVAAAMRTLSARDRQVLHLRFFEDRTQTEIAKEIGVSQMQVSRVIRRAIATLTEEALPSQPSQTTRLRAGLSGRAASRMDR